MNLPEKIKIIEVSLRDGLQNEQIVLKTEDKYLLIRSLIESGVTNIEVTSFVHPKKVPQMADAELLLDMLQWDDNLSYSALIPNLRGFERARNTKIKEVVFVLSASESHNKANVGCNINESFIQLEEVIKAAYNSAIKVKVEVAVSFGCPYEGNVPAASLLDVINRIYRLGCREITVADTIGIADPSKVFDIFTLVKNEFPDLTTTAHFHDTYKMGLANILSAIQAGVNIFDSSVGGLGGCPFAPGVTGNVSTENLVFMLEKMGICTGIDLTCLVKSVLLIEKFFQKNIDLIPSLKKIKGCL
jgi:hydroxymethylglutaryl-CoA lyase